MDDMGRPGRLSDSMTSLARHYGVREFNFWSPILGADAVRLSMVNERGEEYHCIIERLEGSAWKAAKTEACEALQQAIDEGVKPGEIRWK
jgi:hypothetical protein